MAERTCVMIIFPFGIREAAQTCNMKVYINQKTGKVAHFCEWCILLHKKKFPHRMEAYFKKHNLTLEEATAGMLPFSENQDVACVHTPVM
tara:strand:+ start:1391 stop:1660 length:270 start_codon:yes stop_codon:yes gene_type:complete